MATDLARYGVAPDSRDSSHLQATGFGPHDPPYLVTDRRTGRVIEHGFRLEEAAVAYAEALNRVAETGGLP